MAFFSLEPNGGARGRRRRRGGDRGRGPGSPWLAADWPWGGARGRFRSALSELDEVGAALAKARQAVSVLERVADALVVTDRDGSVLHMNRAASALFFPALARARADPEVGWTRAGFELGAPLSVFSFVAPQEHPRFSAFLAAGATAAGAAVAEFWALSRHQARPLTYCFLSFLLRSVSWAQ
eukprot:tig00020903_g15069.t1